MCRRLILTCASALALLTIGTGCKALANRGTGSHFDAPPPHETKPVDTKRREMIVDVTTDANGDVVLIHFQRSSGKDGIDSYVAESIRQSWPRQPLMKSVASLTYSVDKGFSTPKVLSATPVPPSTQ